MTKVYLYNCVAKNRIWEIINEHLSAQYFILYSKFAVYNLLMIILQ